ncbi:MAG TPA: VIT1/CCC1 transporter family protein [Anaerolineae bacterium]
MTNSAAWLENWQREIEGAYLYDRLAREARTPEVMKAMQQMAIQEQEHASVWGDRLRAAGLHARTPRPDLRIRMIAWLGRWLGAEGVLSLLLNDEVSDIASYAGQATEMGDRGTYARVLADETSHARTLQDLQAATRSRPTDHRVEPWHRGVAAGGWLRVVVYGFNDGLTANFGLVMGVVGAAVDSHLILLTGFAGLLADALSMAASGFLAARSEQEVRHHHLTLERAELQLMPDEEQRELEYFYRSKGLTPEEATTVAKRLMERPDVALSELARGELGLDPDEPQSPLQEGIVTGIATGLGAIIPIIPFLLFGGLTAVWVGIAISMLGHFVVGMSRAIFTGRPAIRSGLEMFVVGMGVALFTYLLGLLLGVRA